jgi:hypothetical protein
MSVSRVNWKSRSLYSVSRDVAAVGHEVSKEVIVRPALRVRVVLIADASLVLIVQTLAIWTADHTTAMFVSKRCV